MISYSELVAKDMDRAAGQAARHLRPLPTHRKAKTDTLDRAALHEAIVSGAINEWLHQTGYYSAESAAAYREDERRRGQNCERLARWYRAHRERANGAIKAKQVIVYCSVCQMPVARRVKRRVVRCESCAAAQKRAYDDAHLEAHREHQRRYLARKAAREQAA